MDIIYNHLLKKGFIIDVEVKTNLTVRSVFRYKFIVEGFAEYNIIITSYSNWVFRMETEKKSLSNVVIGFSNHTCFFGVISSENSINILEIILQATGISRILESNSDYKKAENAENNQ